MDNIPNLFVKRTTVTSYPVTTTEAVAAREGAVISPGRWLKRGENKIKIVLLGRTNSSLTPGARISRAATEQKP